MKTLLLPYRFKTIGLIMFIPFCAICLGLFYDGNLGLNNIDWPCISLFGNGIDSENMIFFTIDSTNPINEIGMIGLLVSLCMIALSKEKDEDEMTGLVRMKSFVWSFWITAVIYAIGILFLYDITFLNFAFIALFLVFLLFIIKFNIEMYKIRRESK